MSNDDSFLQSLRETFKIEAGEHTESIASGLLLLEKTESAAEKQQLIETIFRAAHSLKGAARAVNFTSVESVCQALEDVFAAWKRRKSQPVIPMLDVVHQALDAISRTINDREGKADPALAVHVSALQNLNRTTSVPNTAEQVTSSNVPAPEMAIPVLPVEAEKSAIAETVRMAVSKLDARLLEAEEMLGAKLVTQQRESELRELLMHIEEWRNAWTRTQPALRAIRQSLQRSASSQDDTAIPELHRLVEFCDWSHDHMQSIETKSLSLTRTAAHDSLFIGKLVDDLLEDSKRLLMLPLSTLGSFYQKLVRDLCRDQGKQAELVIRGDDVEIDKRILEAMKDPLIHVIRNCVDHGLEAPNQREQLGKASRGTITITVVAVNGDKVELVVADDGAGIDIEKLKSSAIKNGVITPAEASRMSDDDSLALVFRSDVSTSPIITELSGRGLGLAIVREQTEKLGGTASIASSHGAGTSIRITLPITLRTFRGILVRVANHLFVLPTAQVQRVIRFSREQIQTVEGRETLTVNERAVSLVNLAGVLELSAIDLNEESTTTFPAIILGSADEQVAFAIDAVVDEQELLVKRFAKPLSRIRNIAGATVLGSGKLVPILNVSDLLKSAKRIGETLMRFTPAEQPIDLTKSILLVEDSITSRMLLKGILESAGYEVKTAVDGMDAFTLLRTQPFDLVVSDVEMPRLNGFDLTARIRADKKLGELPVVLVTALETREDHEHGIDVGASAYLVKSSFDQSNLLEAVRRLA
ncbi:MAG TPA: response regulator [Pyrinomonadaceae bacterium]|jgi:two-component system chemotaxis sensor kinase CheA|nr:response regulator [Pyrinomonadaceae bacterium]